MELQIPKRTNPWAWRFINECELIFFFAYQLRNDASTHYWKIIYFKVSDMKTSRNLVRTLISIFFPYWESFKTRFSRFTKTEPKVLISRRLEWFLIGLKFDIFSSSLAKPLQEFAYTKHRSACLFEPSVFLTDKEGLNKPKWRLNNPPDKKRDFGVFLRSIVRLLVTQRAENRKSCPPISSIGRDRIN